MQGLRVALLSLAIAGTAAACSTAAGAPSAQPSAVASPQPSAAPTVAPTAVPSASVAALPAALAVAPTISLYEWAVVVPSTLKAGTSTFTISNFGTMPHELLIFKSALAPSAYPVDATGRIQEEGAGVKLVSDGDNIDPSGSQVRSVDLAAGTYLFVCNIPGHFAQKMYTVVTVTK